MTVKGLIVIIFSVGILILACISAVDTGDEIVSPIPTVSSEVRTTEGPDYIGYLKGTYVEGCIGEGATEDYCECTWNYMYRVFGVLEILRMSEVAEDGGLPNGLLEATKFCNAVHDI